MPLKIDRETNYSKDKNLWHLSHEGLDLEDAGNEPLYEKPGFLEMSVSRWTRRIRRHISRSISSRACHGPQRPGHERQGHHPHAQ